MSERTWQDPRVHAAGLELERARDLKSRTERHYLEGVTDRQSQKVDEARIAMENRGKPYYLPRNPNLVDDGHDMMSHGTTTIHRWIEDSDLEARRVAFEAAAAAVDTAEAAYTAAREKSKPVSESQIKAAAKKAGATYAVNKAMKLDGVQYPAGAPVPDKVIDSMSFWKVARWELSGVIRRLTHG